MRLPNIKNPLTWLNAGMVTLGIFLGVMPIIDGVITAGTIAWTVIGIGAGLLLFGRKKLF